MQHNPFDDNTASVDLDYTWVLSSRPEGSNAILYNANTVTPTFVADIGGTYTVELVVSDEEGLPSNPDEVVVGSDNLAPTADAGEDQLVIVSTSVILDGSGSEDPENDPMTYAWSIISAPAGSVATVTDSMMAIAGFAPDVDGTYELTLEVSDPIGPGTPDGMLITATTAGGFAEAKIMYASGIASTLNDQQVTTEGNKKAFLNFLRQSVVAMQEGEMAEAVEKIQKSILRSDGCGVRGEPDGNGPGRDWIVDCSAQAEIAVCLDEALDALASP